MALLYNVTVKIDTECHDEWLNWMLTIHIPDVMATGCFSSYRMTKILGDDDQHGIGYAIQYLAPDMQQFEHYNQHHAPSLQKVHSERYGGRYAAFRTLMEVVREG